MGPFIHLHLHSAFSLAEGAIHISRLKDLCIKHEMPAVAVTDTNNMFAALEASEVLSGAGIQSITGIEIALDPVDCGLKEQRDTGLPSVVLLAQAQAGYMNLMKLSSAVFLNSPVEGEACISLDDLLKFSEGIICLTGGRDFGPVDLLLKDGRQAEAEQLIQKLKIAFGDCLYVELQRYGDEMTPAVKAVWENDLLKLAYDHELPLVATNGVLFPTQDDHDAHDALLCIAAGAYIQMDDRRTASPAQFFKSAVQMAVLFEDLPEALGNTSIIAQRCAFRPRTHPPILPSFAGDTKAEAKELERQAREGLKARLASIELAEEEQVYWDRLTREIGIINNMGFPGYFLIVADFIQWAKTNDIPVGPGRGSGAGSLVAWALTITDLDPLRFGLLFERFLNPERVSMPDFDVDFCQDRRDEVIKYVQEKYGADRVAQIITFGKLQARAVLRDVGRVLNIPFPVVDRLCKLVPNNPANPVTLQEAIDSEEKLREERDSDGQVKELLSKALKLEGLYRHASTHAAGVVIGDRPLDELVPLYLDPRSDMPATQFNMKWVEPAGLVKFDFLGLKTLTVIQRAVQLLAKRGVELDINAVPVTDKKSYDMLSEGAGTGVFQLESSGMRSTLRGMKPDSLDDIIALVSLYRPGPMENIPTYIERKFGREEPDYFHPSLEGILKETYGVIIYQEQVMQIAQVLSGYSLGEADLLRRAMGKKKKEEMDKQKRRFVDGAEQNDVDPNLAESIFDVVAKFAGYGFNKSHAAAYAYIAYQTAYLKANYGPEFLAASMSLDRANTDKLGVFMKETKRAEIAMLAPDVNRSESDFTVENGEVLYALSAIKNVGEQAMQHIIDTRLEGGPFKDIFDFAERVDGRQIGKRGFENLARAGAFDTIHANRAQIFECANFLVQYSTKVADERTSAQGGLFGDNGGATLARPPLKSVHDWPGVERLDHERKSIGFYFSGHPLDEYEAGLEKLNVTSSADFAEEVPEDGRTPLTIAGVVRSFTPRRSQKTGKPFAWVEISDPAGEFEVTVFSELLDASRDHLTPGTLIVMSVNAEDNEGDVRLTGEGVRLLDDAVATAKACLRIIVSSHKALPSIKTRLFDPNLSTAKGGGSASSGAATLVMFMADLACEVEIEIPEPVPATVAMKGALKTIDGVADVELFL